MIVCDACNKKITTGTSECDRCYDEDNHYCNKCIKSKDGESFCPKCYSIFNEQYNTFKIINKYTQECWKTLKFGNLVECNHNVTDKAMVIEYILSDIGLRPTRKSNDELGNIKVLVTAIKDRNDQINKIDYVIKNLEPSDVRISTSLLDRNKAIKALKEQIASALISRSDNIKHTKTSMLGKLEKQVLEWDNAINFIDNTLKSWETK